MYSRYLDEIGLYDFVFAVSLLVLVLWHVPGKLPAAEGSSDDFLDQFTVSSNDIVKKPTQHVHRQLTNELSFER